MKFSKCAVHVFSFVLRQVSHTHHVDYVIQKWFGHSWKKRKENSPGLWQRIRWQPSKHPNFLSFQVWHPKNWEVVITLWVSSFESMMVHTREVDQQNKEEERPFADNFFPVEHTWDPSRQNTLAFIHNKCSPIAILHLTVAARVNSTLYVAQDCKFCV